MVAANARTAITFALSPGQACDTTKGRKLLGGIGPLPAPLHLIMDRAYTPQAVQSRDSRCNSDLSLWHRVKFRTNLC